MSLSRYEDFLHMCMNNLFDFLAVRGLSASGRKIELVARAYAAVEMGLPIIASSEEQNEKLKAEYKSRLQKYSICDPWTVPANDRCDDIKKWPKVDVGVVFSFILKVRDFDVDYIGRYKDQKAYSYFDSGFVDLIFTHEPLSPQNVVFVYSTVQASQSVNSNHKLWIIIAKLPIQILTSWCDCMAGASQYCNHVIATLYKIDYANRKGYNDPECTSLPCNWNKASKKTIEPKRISDIVVRKKLRTQADKKGDENSEGIRANALNTYDPRHTQHRVITDESVSDLYGKLYNVTPTSVVFKCIPMGDDDAVSSKIYSLADIANEV